MYFFGGGHDVQLTFLQLPLYYSLLYVCSCLRAECVVQDGLSTSEPVNTVYYTFEHKFPPEVEIANVTWKVIPVCF